MGNALLRDVPTSPSHGREAEDWALSLDSRMSQSGHSAVCSALFGVYIVTRQEDILKQLSCDRVAGHDDHLVSDI